MYRLLITLNDKKSLSAEQMSVENASLYSIFLPGEAESWNLFHRLFITLKDKKSPSAEQMPMKNALVGTIKGMAYTDKVFCRTGHNVFN